MILTLVFAVGAAAYADDQLDGMFKQAMSKKQTSFVDSIVTDLIKTNHDQYEPQGKLTRCSRFIKDVVEKYFDKQMTDFETERVSSQVKALDTLVFNKTPGWTSFSGSDGDAMKRAADIARAGGLVLATSLTIPATDTDSGHIVVVRSDSPSSGNLLVAQAGAPSPPDNAYCHDTGVDESISISCAWRRSALSI